MNSKKIKLNSFLKRTLPDFSFSFAYGSAIMPQVDNKGKKMIDIIIFVDNLKKFHQENMKLNPNHYSVQAKLLGPNIISKINRIGNKSYYNPYIDIGEEIDKGVSELKYGIIETKSALNQLRCWSNFFLCGRLQKPVMFLDNKDERKNLLNQLLRKNIESAVIWVF